MKKILLLFVGFLVAIASDAQKAKPKTDAVSTVVPKVDLYKGLKWRNIGPFRGGRANAIAGSPVDPMVYYVGYTGGGVAKTDDGGTTWKNISDGFFKVGSIGDIAVCETDPNVIYVGTGEHAVRGVMTSYGDGVYKSTDGGTTWKNIGLEKTRHISDVVVHPTNSDVVYVAAQGTVHGANTDRGIYKSIDGGATWKKTLFVDENTGASSLSMDMTNPRILYAATWQHRRYPWKVESGGAGCAIWKSTDAGETWSKIIDGLPKEMGKIGVSVSRANPNRVFAIVEAEKSKAGLYRSDDGGKKWNLLSTDQNITSRSWYYMEVFADPVNADVVYVLNAPMTRSIDGGKTFSTIRVGHGDTHDLWINPKNNQNFALADDGGGEISYNTGRTWSPLNNQATSQFYRVIADNRFPYWVYGGQQDNSSVATPSRNGSFGITDKDWMNGPGCESAWVAFNDPNNPELLYGGCYQGQIDVLDTRTSETKDLQEYPSTNLAYAPKKMKYRFNWNAPLINSPHDPKVMYHAANVLFKTINGGLSWEVISPDISASRYKFNDYGNLTYKSVDYGKSWTKIGAGVEADDFIKVIREDKKVKGLLYAGAERGFYISYDGGATFSRFQLNLPIVPVTDLTIRDNDLVAATAGRSFWILDDLSAIQQSKGNVEAALKIFTPKPTYRLSSVTIPEYFGDIPGLGRNPANGVLLDYFLKDKADTAKVKLEILNASGKVIRTYTNKKDESFKPYPGGPPAKQTIPAEAGLNRFAWDFRTEALSGVPGVFVYGDYSGYRVAPGKYKARITHKGQTAETELEIIADPRIQASAADWDAQQAFLKQASEQFEEIHKNVNKMRQVKKQIETYNESLKDNADAKEIINTGKELIKKIEKWENNLIEPRSKNFQDVINFPNKLNSEFLQLRSVSDTHDPRLTKGVQDRARDVNADWAKYKQQMQELINSDISNYNKLFKDKNMPALITETKETTINE
ncbi:MAG: glycosyl hydrolase [Cytophagia bacterium]|nr:glycosyl hydrolase [Cytophagia bacterium]